MMFDPPKNIHDVALKTVISRWYSNEQLHLQGVFPVCHCYVWGHLRLHDLHSWRWLPKAEMPPSRNSDNPWLLPLNSYIAFWFWNHKHWRLPEKNHRGRSSAGDFHSAKAPKTMPGISHSAPRKSCLAAPLGAFAVSALRIWPIKFGCSSWVSRFCILAILPRQNVEMAEFTNPFWVRFQWTLSFWGSQLTRNQWFEQYIWQ